MLLSFFFFFLTAVQTRAMWSGRRRLAAEAKPFCVNKSSSSSKGSSALARWKKPPVDACTLFPLSFFYSLNCPPACLCSLVNDVMTLARKRIGREGLPGVKVETKIENRLVTFPMYDSVHFWKHLRDHWSTKLLHFYCHPARLSKVTIG